RAAPGAASPLMNDASASVAERELIAGVSARTPTSASVRAVASAGEAARAPSTSAHAASSRATRPERANIPDPRRLRYAPSASTSSPSGGKPFISNNTLMKIIGSQNSIGMARFLTLHVLHFI